jgi:hypothetical protein
MRSGRHQGCRPACRNAKAVGQRHDLFCSSRRWNDNQARRSTGILPRVEQQHPLGATIKEVKPMTFFRNLTATLAFLAAGAGSTAFAATLSVVNQGESVSVQFEDGDAGDIVGGGPVRVTGQGESQEIAYGDSRFAHRAAGIPVFTGGSEGGVAYQAVLPAAILATR